MEKRGRERCETLKKLEGKEAGNWRQRQERDGVGERLITELEGRGNDGKGHPW
jgi:hypothetical protein